MSQRFVSVEITSNTPTGMKFDGIYNDSEYSTLLTTSTKYDYVAESGTLKKLFIKYSYLPINLLFTPHPDVDYIVNGSFGSVLVSRGNTTNQLISVPDHAGSTTFRIDSIELVGAHQFAGHIPAIRVDGSEKNLPFTSMPINAGNQVNVGLMLREPTTTTSTSTLPPTPLSNGTLRFEYHGNALPLTITYSDPTGTKEVKMTDPIDYFPVVSSSSEKIFYNILSIDDSLGNTIDLAQVNNISTGHSEGVRSIPLHGSMYPNNTVEFIIDEEAANNATSTSTSTSTLPPMPVVQEATIKFEGEGTADIIMRQDYSDLIPYNNIILPGELGLSRTIPSNEALHNNRFVIEIKEIGVNGNGVENVSVYNNGIPSEEKVPFTLIIEADSVATITIPKPTTSTSTIDPSSTTTSSTSTKPPHESTLVLNTNAPSSTIKVSTEDGTLGYFTINNDESRQIQIV